MRTKQLESIIEAILFTMGDSVEVSKIASAIEQDVPTTEKLIHNMMDKYQKEERGIRIIELDHAYQLCSKPEMYEYLIRIAKQPKKYVLTDVMLETLSIIAYRQPIMIALAKKGQGQLAQPLCKGQAARTALFIGCKIGAIVLEPCGQ